VSAGGAVCQTAGSKQRYQPGPALSSRSEPPTDFGAHAIGEGELEKQRIFTSVLEDHHHHHHQQQRDASGMNVACLPAFMYLSPPECSKDEAGSSQRAGETSEEEVPEPPSLLPT